MKIEDLQKLISKKVFPIESFFVTGNLHTDGNPDSVLRHGVTNYFLSSVILELLVKILYEIEFKEQAPFTHNILNIYEQLSTDTKTFVRTKYDEARERRKAVFKTVDNTVSFPPFTNFWSQTRIS